MSTPCPETSFVEALWDGRLDADREGAMRGHIENCQVCASEARRLESLREKLRSLPAPPASPLAVAAGRRLLLEAAREATPVRAARGRALVYGTAALALAAGIAFWVSRTTAFGREHGFFVDPATFAARPSELELRVTPGAEARWSRATTGLLEVVSLAAGSLDISVDRHHTERRLIVKLPDGELEDEGTVFSVTVAGEHTQRVSVAQGSVTLRLDGQASRHLAAGETFEAPSPSAPPSDDRTTPSADDTPGTASRHPEPSPGGASATARGPKGGSDADACPGAPRFEDCVDTFKRGEYAAAAEALGRYTAACGRHAEDATYLRMVSLARAGRAPEAAALARSYLARFPEGFRRKEAERLAGGS